MHDLRNLYANRRANVKFVLLTRDPRAVLTSFHHSRPDEYYVPAERWRGIYSYWEWASSAEDVTTVRYEDLITKPLETQSQLSDFIGWEVHHPFADFHNAVPDGFDTRALNGVRQLDPQNINRWSEPQYAGKLTRLLTSELPELPQRLMELGYESDRQWAEEYLRRSAA